MVQEAGREDINFVPMSNEEGVVTNRVMDVMKNQLDDKVVDGLWVHYTAKQWLVYYPNLFSDQIKSFPYHITSNISGISFSFEICFVFNMIN